jgi:hypothetical protein
MGANKEEVTIDFVSGEGVVIIAESQKEYFAKLEEARKNFNKGGFELWKIEETPLIAMNIAPIYYRKSIKPLL